MPSGNSCRQISVSTQLARLRRTAWKKVSRIFTCCCRSPGDRDAAFDEHIPSLDATNTTARVSSKYGPHSRHLTQGNNKRDTQQQSRKVIPSNINGRSPHSHKTVCNTWITTNSSEPQQSLVTLSTVSKDQNYPLSEITPDKIIGDFPVASMSLRALSSHCRTPVGDFTRISSSGNWPFPRTLVGEVPTPFKSFEMLVFSSTSPEDFLSPSTSSRAFIVFCTSSRKTITPSPSSGELLVTFILTGDVLTPSRSCGSLQFNNTTTRELVTPLPSYVTLYVSYTSYGKAYTLSKSLGALLFLWEFFEEVTPLTSFGSWLFFRTSPGEVFSATSFGTLPLPCTSPGRALKHSATSEVFSDTCTSPGDTLTSTSSEALFSFSTSSRTFTHSPSYSGSRFTCTLPRDVLPPLTPFRGLRFSFGISRQLFNSSTTSQASSPLSGPHWKIFFPSTSFGLLSSTCRTHGKLFTPLTSSGVLSSPCISSGLKFTPKSSFGAPPVPCKVPMISTSSGSLSIPSARSHREVSDPLASSKTLSFPRSSSAYLFTPSKSSGASLVSCIPSGKASNLLTSFENWQCRCKLHKEVFTPLPPSNGLPFPKTSRGKEFNPPSSSGEFTCSFTLTSSRELLSTPSISSRVFSLPYTLPMKGSIPATPSDVFRPSCIPPGLSPLVMFSCVSHCKIMTDTYSVSTPYGQLLTRSVPVITTVSTEFAVTSPHFTSLVTGKTKSTSQRTQPRLKIQKARSSCLEPSLHSETYICECIAQDITLDDTKALNTASVFSDCFNASQSTLSATSSHAEFRDTRDFGCYKSFPSSRYGVDDFDKWNNFANHTSVRPTKQLFSSFNSVSENGYCDQTIKFNSLPVCTNGSYNEKAAPAQYHIFASSLPSVIQGEIFIQKTASCQSECFILSNSTVSSNARHQNLTPSYSIPVCHQGFPFTSGYSASWDKWDNCGSFTTSSGFIPLARPLSRSCDDLNNVDQSDQKTKVQSLPADVSDRYDDTEADLKVLKRAFSVPVILCEDECPENTASCTSGCFNLSRSSSVATNSGPGRTIDLTVSFQKDAWSSCSAGDSPLGRTASSLSACFNVSDVTISTAFSKDAQQSLDKLHSVHQASPTSDVIASPWTFCNNPSKSADRISCKAAGKRETGKNHPIQQKETNNSGQRPQAPGPVIGLGDARHLVKNILKGLSAEGDHQTFKSIPLTCPIIRPLDLTDVAGNRSHPTILGEGSFGIVQLMKHLPTMKLCAVKIPKEDLKRDRMYENFYREVNVLSTLRGLDCIPHLFGASRAGSNLDLPILVQEFIGDPFTYESTTLQSAILKKLLSSRKAECIALQVCNGVREIHSRGILHCDLKVDNVMLLPGFIDAKYPKIKIIDFGMAVTVNGSPRYEIVDAQYLNEVSKQCRHIAPEVLRGLKPYSETSDIYSLGLVLKNLAGLTTIYLKDLGQKCMGQEGTRPQLKDIINSLESKVSSHDNPV